MVIAMVIARVYAHATTPDGVPSVLNVGRSFPAILDRNQGYHTDD